MSLHYRLRLRNARLNRRPVNLDTFRNKVSNPDRTFRTTLKAGMVITAGLLTTIHAVNILATDFMTPTVTNIQPLPAEAQAWADAHPEVEVIAAEQLQVGVGPFQTVVGGYVPMTDNTSTIYISTILDGRVDWNYILHHEHAHILQENHIAQQAGTQPSADNPTASLQFFTTLLATENQMSEAFPTTEGVIQSAVGIDSLERSADCYAQQQSGVTDLNSYQGDIICTETQNQAAAYSLPAGAMPHTPNPVADQETQQNITASVEKLAAVAKQAEDTVKGGKRPLGAAGNPAEPTTTSPDTY